MPLPGIIKAMPSMLSEGPPKPMLHSPRQRSWDNGLIPAPLVCVTCNPFSLFSICFKPHDIIIRILSGSNPMMVRYELWFLKSISLIAKNRYQQIVNHLFHSLWKDGLTRRTVKPILWFLCELSKMVRVSRDKSTYILLRPKPGAHPP